MPALPDLAPPPPSWPGSDPAIHANAAREMFAWMPASRAGMTERLAGMMERLAGITVEVLEVILRRMDFTSIWGMRSRGYPAQGRA
jgi:hypothetical protein